MTNVLMAIDESQESKRAAEVATACFGPNANYFVIYVDQHNLIAGPTWGPGVGWGVVHTYPMLPPDQYQPAAGDGPSDGSPAVGTTEGAQEQAERFAAEAGVTAEPLGGVAIQPP